MTGTVADVMTTNPLSIESTETISAAARQMRDHDTGDMLVTDNGELVGIVTDRDIVVRSIANGADPTSTQIREALSPEIQYVTATDSIDAAVEVMRGSAIRRLPVVEGGRIVGILSLGDLARSEDAESVLAQISAAPANT